LFKLFGTISSTKKLNTKGVGLGLSITKMISNAFGGDATVLSKKGCGSVFISSLQIPIKGEAEESVDPLELELRDKAWSKFSSMLQHAKSNFGNKE